MLIKLALTLIGIKMEEGGREGEREAERHRRRTRPPPLRASRDPVTHAIAGRIWKHTRDLYRHATESGVRVRLASLSRRAVDDPPTPPPTTRTPKTHSPPAASSVRAARSGL